MCPIFKIFDSKARRITQNTKRSSAINFRNAHRLCCRVFLVFVLYREIQSSCNSRLSCAYSKHLRVYLLRLRETHFDNRALHLLQIAFVQKILVSQCETWVRFACMGCALVWDATCRYTGSVPAPEHQQGG